MSLAWVAQQILDPHQGRAPVTPRAELVYRLVCESGGMTYRGLMLATGRSRSTVERYTDEALAAGLVKIRMGGPRRNTAWIEPVCTPYSSSFPGRRRRTPYGAMS